MPYPADYGGAIDVFYRLKALHKLGVKITLHCYEYGRPQQDELLKYTEAVHYYPRKKSVFDTIGKTPFIVKTRNSKQLMSNLSLDDSPILFEGLHTCYSLDDACLKNRTKIVRTHNIEHEYYAELAKNNKGLTKRFYSGESRKLKKFESQLKYATHILAIKESDANHFKQYSDSLEVLPAASKEISGAAKRETDDSFLFHGNLSVEENEIGAKWLINEVFSNLNLENKLKIAGKDPSPELIKICEKHNVELITNPSEDAIQALIESARVHVFYSSQATGVKLKLINVLSSSGHIVVNENMILGTNLYSVCSLAKDAIEFQNLIQEKIKTELPEVEFHSRIAFLGTNYSTVNNSQILLNLI
ncbi:MAG: glycosyltransferase [Crocinitomicaceae bacterium]|nr:glycosyltransferase [Crocinitomicaceae bacterium]